MCYVLTRRLIEARADQKKLSASNRVSREKKSNSGLFARVHFFPPKLNRAIIGNSRGSGGGGFPENRWQLFKLPGKPQSTIQKGNDYREALAVWETELKKNPLLKKYGRCAAMPKGIAV